ncbi:hypothetical protein B0T20DRAFT_352453 [Sordaria brevicollis]|uniref:Uncharacterized protein n=1 Tax=Sordaria brevicollis TaxID=83679 RepID=A0AAE0UCA1_SORBR|nr:hypothetical protein B0T20DRAFT_352453 [Sordaria brevicollis]
MAAEVAKDRSDDATHVTSEAEPTIKIDAPDAQNAPLDQSQVKGETASPATEEIENKHISDIANEVVTSAEVSVSGGSDNEAAKGSKDDKPRSSSTVKKPVAFKAINVNQKFLTTKATTPAAPAKVAEKPAATATLSSTSGSLTARPRLIAKTGSGSVKSATGANGKSGSAPDPNAVWNKNRPAPPPEPKKYTDEELKKYGIHMANRLQPEDTKGQANWADIDDDDEDWAPETITWKDGTKIAIPHTPEITPAPPAPAPAEPEPVPKPVEAVKESVAAEKPKSPAPGHASVIKPGVLGSGKGLILKGAAEKPTLVAKPPPPPAPVKSPWAQLPKVDKVSPMVVEPPPQPPSQHAPKWPSRDGPAQYTGFPPAGPKEIAADDFSRGPWRDGPPGGGNRELYNSHSGRYEPVQDRRGSMRPEPQYGRQPAVLQRPAHNDHHGPAEPSAAFQTHRTSDQHVPYGRRRGSSNVSGVSSGFLNRAKGFEQPLHPPEILNVRRESMTAGSDGPGSPRNFSPSGLQHGPRHPHPHNQGWPPRVSPAVGHAVPVPHHHGPPDMVGVPPVGPPPVQEQVPIVTDQEIELQKKLMREKVEAARKRRMEEEEREEAARKERIRLKLQALGPAPESNSAKKAAAKEHPAPSTTEGAPQAGTTDEHRTSEKAEVKTPTFTQPEKVEQQPNGAPPQQILPDSEPLENRQPQGTNTQQQQQPLWKQQGRYTATWGSQTSTKNVWGPPTNNRTLGNGTFNPDLGTSPPPVSNKPGPGPIAPPNRNTMGSKTNLFPDGAPARLPPIAPPTQSSASSGRMSDSERQAKANQWANAARLNDQAFDAMLKERFAEQDRRRAEKGLTVEDVQPTVKDVWRPTKLDENGMRVEAGPRQTVRVGKENPWAASQPAQQTQPPAANTMLANAGPAPRTSSRFFPSRQQTIAAAEYERPHSPSPPPPDTQTTGHPAFDGDVKHPHVCIPTPRPQVRLPPPAQAREEIKVQHPEAPKPQGPSFSWANTVAYKGEERTPAPAPGSPWQARIDNLLGARKPSHSSQKPAPGVDSTSRAAYEHASETSVTVSLTASMIAEASPTTKVMDEDCFEEQEMGSLPTVRIPTELPDMTWMPAPPLPPKPLPRKLFPLTTSAEPIRIDSSSNGIGSVIRIAFPGTDRHPPFVTAVTIPFSRTRSNPRRGGGAPRGGRHSTVPHNQRGMPGGRGSGRDRDPSSPNDQGPSGPPTGPNGSHQQTRGRGGYRGRDSAWSRSAPTAIQTS